MNYSEFNPNSNNTLEKRCIECGLLENNHNAYHRFNDGMNNARWAFPNKVKIECVPSGMCHSNSLS